MASKWRPVPSNCLYVIADVHGRYEQLKLIFNRIFPLRRSDGVKDTLIMLGDYIDRHPDSHKIIDTLIQIKKKYKDQVILLRGNHEVMLLNAIGKSIQKDVHSGSADAYLLWMHNGGEQTLSGYLKRANQPTDNPYTITRFRVPDFIPKEHIDFLQNTLINFYETDDYIFAHAGYKYDEPPEKQKLEEVWWGSGIFSTAQGITNRGGVIPWEKTIVIGHYWKGPYITDKFMMLDRTYFNEILVTELNSMEAYVAKPDNEKRLVKFRLQKAEPKGVFRRAE